jgi:hypothetical protein
MTGQLPGGAALRKWLGRKTLAALALATGLVVVATIGAAFDAVWPAIGVLGLLQVMLLALMLIECPAADSSKRIDSLSSRLMAALETERLDARDRHDELLRSIREQIDSDSGHAANRATTPEVP